MSVSIYTGRWTDESKGSILGDQVTIHVTSSNILIAFLAIFVTFVGGVAWMMIAQMLHHLRVSRKPQTGFHHQIQALLRTSSGPAHFAFSALRVGSAWSKHKKARGRILFTAVTLALFALLVNVAFIAAGLLLSLVGTTGHVLLKSSTCGVWDITGFGDLPQVEALETWLAAWQYGDTAVAQALEYTRSCYPSTGNAIFTAATDQVSAANCEFYVKPSLNWTTTYPIECPFGDYCAGTPSSNVVRFDTGYLDSLRDLGLNAAESETLRFRRVTTCAPINTEPFTNGWTNHSDYGTVAMYDFGQNFLQPAMKPWQDDYNHTFIYPYTEYQAKSQPYSVIMASTDIVPVTSERLKTNGFIPDSRLASENASVLLMFLANRAYYYALPVVDPWFNATSLLPPTDPLASGAIAGVPLWYSAQPGTVLGCVNEHELCNPALDTCIDWDIRPISQLGLSPAQLQPLNLSSRQMAQLNTISTMTYLSNMGFVIDTQGASALIAHSYLGAHNSLLSLPLNATDWISELQNLQATTLTILQAGGVSTILGGASDQLKKVLSPPTNDAEKWACTIQMVKSSDYRTFSILGLGLIFGLGSFIIVMGLLARFVLPIIQTRRGKTSRQRTHWIANGLLHLQRIAFERRGLGHWAGKTIDDDGDADVPITEELESFMSFADYENEEAVESPPYTESKDEKSKLIVAAFPRGSSTDSSSDTFEKDRTSSGEDTTLLSHHPAHSAVHRISMTMDESIPLEQVPLQGEFMNSKRSSRSRYTSHIFPSRPNSTHRPRSTGLFDSMEWIVPHLNLTYSSTFDTSPSHNDTGQYSGFQHIPDGEHQS